MRPRLSALALLATLACSFGTSAAAESVPADAQDAQQAIAKDAQQANAKTAPPAAASSAPVATSKTAILEQALEAYSEAQATGAVADRPAAFARAERLFAAAATGGGSAELWTNVGTAALQAEHIGTAVLAYRRALALDPDNRHAQQNLVHARTLLPAWVPRPEGGGFLDSLLAWQHAMSASERRGAAALAFLLGAAMFGAALAGGSTALRVFSVAPMIVWVLLLVAGSAAASEKTGVIAGAETIARAADSRNAPARFAEPLPAGTEVAIAEVRGDWTRIVLADGRDAWVATASVDRIE